MSSSSAESTQSDSQVQELVSKTDAVSLSSASSAPVSEATLLEQLKVSCFFYIKYIVTYVN